MVDIYELLNCNQQQNGSYLQMALCVCVAFFEEQEKDAGRLWCQDDGM